jgi:exopolyphosphatase/guanosine-5'-triphosphate,3'-diphosphate pyrophosphatase
MRIAILDLGTNTFNLLIAEETGNKGYTILLNTKEGVKLGKGGINKKYIEENAFQRGIEAIDRHYDWILDYKVDKIVAFATSAIRDAENGKEFTDKLKAKFNLDINIISGDKEAELIYLGVKQTLTFTGKRFLLLDIGGGSNELIIADDTKIMWKRSFKLGMARLLEKFNPSDPITPSEILTIENYLHFELTELFDKVRELKPAIFIGASGSFDSFMQMLKEERILRYQYENKIHPLPLNVYRKLHEKLIKSSSAEREQMKGLEPVRRDMIVLATLFINFVLRETKITEVYQSCYSLKEGAVYEIIQGSL